MIETRQRYLPVMDGDTLLGVLSFHDVARASARGAELREPDAEGLHQGLARRRLILRPPGAGIR